MKKSPLGILLPIAAFILLAFTFQSCAKSDSNSGQSSRMNIYLTDAPADYKAVWIDIQQIMIKRTDDDSENGWTAVPLKRPGRYNLLELRNGKDTILGGVDLPAGRVSQIRLILGDNNQVVLKNGTVADLKTPSAQQSGLKVKIDAELIAGIPYEIVLDFDASRSIVEAGNSGQYILKPVIRTFARAAGGAIQGVVLPGSASAMVTAVSGVDTLGAIPDASGAYKFWGLSPGNYSLMFTPDVTTGYKAVTLKDIAVTIGTVTNAGTVTLVK